MKAVVRAVPAMLGLLAWRDRRRRGAWAAALAAGWVAAYLRHERAVRVRSERERSRLGVRDNRAVRRALEERPPSAAPWLESDVRRDAGVGLTVVVGSGDGSLLEMVPAAGRAVGVDVSSTAAREGAKSRSSAGRGFVQADGTRLPLRTGVADLVVVRCAHRTTRPEDMVWEAGRALRPGGRVVLAAPNACRAPSATPLTHALVWVARAVGAHRPWLVPGRGWTEPRPIEPELRSTRDGPDVWLPRAEHVPLEIEWLLRGAGFGHVEWRAVGRFEGVPGLRRLGPRLVVRAIKAREPVAAVPPLGMWRGAQG